MQTTIRFIVLSITKVGDNSLVLHTLSEAYGRRGFIVKVSKSSGMALWLPLNILEAEVIENKKSDLWRLRNVSSVYPLNGIRSDIRKNSISLFMSEVLFRSVHEACCEEGLSAWCERSILTLDALNSDFSNFHIVWLLELCSALGFRPAPADLAPFLGGEVSSPQSSLTNIVGQMMGVPYSRALLVPMSGQQRTALATGLIEYLSFHLGTKINVRSLPVLSELFGTLSL